MIRKPHRSEDLAAALSGVDQRLRECLQALWLTLPNGQDKTTRRAGRYSSDYASEAQPLSPDQAYEQLELQFRRLVDRALRDFKEDMEQFQ